MNQKRFVTQDYSSADPVAKEMVFKYISVPATPVAYKFEIQRTLLETDDNILMSIPGLTEKENEFFSIK